MMTISDLPEELESEILSRVSAKTLWELKTTCKRWYALFRDPRFVEKNKKLGKAVRESMLRSNDMVYSMAGDLHSSYTPIKLTGKLRDLKGSKDLYSSDIFHCDGLMLCSNEGSSKLVVWNPCTGQRTKIKARTCGSNDIYALGYSTSSSSSSSCGHSYKILRCFEFLNDQEVWVPQCEIYELCSGSWRVLDSFSHDYFEYCNGMSLKGDTYFVARDKETGFFLMKFDFTAERFVRLPLPFQSIHSEDTATLSVVKDEKLSLLHIDDRSGVMTIWVTNKIDDDEEEAKDFSWNCYLVVLLQMGFDKFHLWSVESFLLDEENRVAVCCRYKYMGDGGRTSIYIVGKDMCEQVYEDTIKPSKANYPVVLTYLPSLVLVQTKRHT
ncbi:putative F-box/kelch-repeat protein At3g17540 [Raphanus sativus]|uniref:F-box/kelch-repeat protein At3g17540 n=1 Tax=Raphanus sativus TaxID=3726 RepID=A0A6J0P858_RAPSA|nr:putative F-box/kelch-repeat protein At3g17540 [Raphanus sativus]